MQHRNWALPRAMGNNLLLMDTMPIFACCPGKVRFGARPIGNCFELLSIRNQEGQYREATHFNHHQIASVLTTNMISGSDFLLARVSSTP